MPYRVQVARPALRQLRNLPLDIQDRLRPRIQGLGDNPRPPGSTKLVGETAFRLRAGDYRIIYELDDAAALVTVTLILHRKDAYRRR